MSETDKAWGRRVLVPQQALDAAVDAGKAALPKETGGILLGFRTPEGLVATRLLVVEDRSSSGHSYLRRRRPAQRLLDDVRLQAGAAVGYIGDWHTHPLDVGPNRADARSVAAACRDAGGPVALLVLSYSGLGLGHTYAQVAERTHPGHPLIRSVDIGNAELDVMDDPPEALEREAAAFLTERDTHR